MSNSETLTSEVEPNGSKWITQKTETVFCWQNKPRTHCKLHMFLCLFSILVQAAFILSILLTNSVHEWLDCEISCRSFSQKPNNTSFLKQNAFLHFHTSLGFLFSHPSISELWASSLNVYLESGCKAEITHARCLAHYIRLHKGTSVWFPVSEEHENHCIGANPLHPGSCLELWPKTWGRE